MAGDAGGAAGCMGWGAGGRRREGNQFSCDFYDMNL